MCTTLIIYLSIIKVAIVVKYNIIFLCSHIIIDFSTLRDWIFNYYGVAMFLPDAYFFAYIGLGFVVFNATFNNISFVSWR